MGGPDHGCRGISRVTLLRCVIALVLCGSRGIATAQEPAAEDPGPVEYSVLTPGLEGEYYVASGFDPMGFFTGIGLGAYSDRFETRELRRLIERTRYDFAPPLAAAIVSAIEERGRSAVHEPQLRRAPGRLQSLAISDLPENPRGKIMLDVVVQWICLRSGVAGGRQIPTLAFTWRLIGADGDLISPGRQLMQPVRTSDKNKGKGRNKKGAKDPDKERVADEFLERCGFESVKSMEQELPRLLACFDESWLAAGRQIAAALPAP